MREIGGGQPVRTDPLNAMGSALPTVAPTYDTTRQPGTAKRITPILAEYLRGDYPDVHEAIIAAADSAPRCDPRTAQLVFIRVLWHIYEPTGWTYVGAERIGADIGMSRDAVGHNLRLLESCGALVRKPGTGQGGRTYRTACWTQAAAGATAARTPALPIARTAAPPIARTTARTTAPVQHEHEQQHQHEHEQQQVRAHPGDDSHEQTPDGMLLAINATIGKHGAQLASTRTVRDALAIAISRGLTGEQLGQKISATLAQRRPRDLGAVAHTLLLDYVESLNPPPLPLVLCPVDTLPDGTSCDGNLHHHRVGQATQCPNRQATP